MRWKLISYEKLLSVISKAEMGKSQHDDFGKKMVEGFPTVSNFSECDDILRKTLTSHSSFG